MARSACHFCGEDADYICERCLRCEKCDAEQDKKREIASQHLGKWLWHRMTLKAVQLIALAAAGHGKGDNQGKK